MIIWQATQINDPGTCTDIIIWSERVWGCVCYINMGECDIFWFSEYGGGGGVRRYIILYSGKTAVDNSLFLSQGSSGC